MATEILSSRVDSKAFHSLGTQAVPLDFRQVLEVVPSAEPHVVVACMAIAEMARNHSAGGACLLVSDGFGCCSLIGPVHEDFHVPLNLRVLCVVSVQSDLACLSAKLKARMHFVSRAVMH